MDRLPLADPLRHLSGDRKPLGRVDHASRDRDRTAATSCRPWPPCTAGWRRSWSRWSGATAGLLLVPHGAQKLFGAFGGGGLAGTAQFLDGIGYQPGMLWALALGSLEFFGGILLAFGLFTLPVAAAVAVFMAIGVLHHLPSGFFWPDGGFEYPLLWGVVALSFAVRGGARYSLDAKLGREIEAGGYRSGGKGGTPSGAPAGRNRSCSPGRAARAAASVPNVARRQQEERGIGAARPR